MKHEYPEKFSAVHFGLLTNSIGVICSSAIVIGVVMVLEMLSPVNVFLSTRVCVCLCFCVCACSMLICMCLRKNLGGG